MPRGRGLGGDTFCAVLSDGPAGRRLGGNGESHLALDILMLLSCSLSCLLLTSACCLLCPHSPPGHREEPYLTEAGRDAFDRFCRLRQGELQVLGGSLLQAPQPVLVKECELVKDALNVLIGVVSATFSLCQVRR